MKSSLTSTLIILLATLGSFSPTLRAADYFVAQDGQSAKSPFASWTTAASNIADAVALAENNDTVWVDAGTYLLEETLLITKNITLCGTNGTVTLDGGGTIRCLDMPSASATLANLTFVNGYTEGSGGGVSLYNGTVTNCVFSNNTALAHGGGVYAGTPGSAQFYDCRFVANHATTNGGGGYALNRQQFYDCEFADNLAVVDGGGLHFNNGLGIAGVLVTNCTFRGNIASNSYGGVYVRYVDIFDSSIQSNRAVTGNGGGLGISGSSNLTRGIANNCIISDNTAVSGGGVFHPPYGVLRNCRILRNRATGGTWSSGAGGVTLGTGSKMYDCIIAENIGDKCTGGVIGSYGALLQNSLICDNRGASVGGVFLPYGGSIRSCTITGNQGGGGYSGGVYNRFNDAVTFYNTIIYGNVAGVNSNYALNVNASIAFTNCCFAPVLTEQAIIDNSFGNLVADPRFVHAAGSNYHLRGSSPCFNAGLNRSWMTDALDLDGKPRIRYGVVDMGCFEVLLSGSLLQIR